MALVKPVVFQVVGYQNSGKTTFSSKVVHQLKAHQFRAVTIKHHGHGGKPDAWMSKDTGKHLGSGAIAAIVEGDGRLLLQAEDYDCNLEDQIELLTFFKPDVILIEGYKQEHYPKLLLVREPTDIALLGKVNNVIATICWSEEIKNLITKKWAGPSFLITDETAINWTIHFVKNQLNHD
jgi:molybdopterin-guanine dinucleotide biosynthesis adapter protein